MTATLEWWYYDKYRENHSNMPRGTRVDETLLEAALIGFEQMRGNIAEKMASIRRTLGGDGARAEAAPVPRRRPLSTAARRRIAAAQRKRWALAKAKQAGPKRTMSIEARRKIAAAQRKRWAAAKKAPAKKIAARAGAKKVPASEKKVKTATSKS